MKSKEKERFRFSLSRFILFATVIIVSYLAVIPLVFLIYGSVWSSSPGDPSGFLTLDHYVRVFSHPSFMMAASNSVFYSAGATLLALLLGTFLAFIYERTDTPGRKLTSVLVLTPFIIPGILHAIAWIFLLSPRIGLINLALMNLLGLDEAPFNIYSLAGMIWVEALHYTPLVFLMMSAAFRSLDPAFEEASRISGAGTLSTFYHVSLRVVKPAILAAVIVMFVRAMEGFEVPALLGIPARIYVLTTSIYHALTRYPFDYGLAAVEGMFILLITYTGVALYRKSIAGAEKFQVITGKGFRPGVIRLGKWRWLACAALLAYFILAVGLPLFILLYSSLLRYYTIPSWDVLAQVSLDNYIRALTYPLSIRALLNSLLLAVASATVLMFLTSVIAWITVKTRVTGRGVLDFLATGSLAFPGIVLGVALMWTYLVLPLPIYGTLWILLIAYLTKFMPYGMRYSSASMIQIGRDLEESARVCGASWAQTFRRVLLPLIKPGFLAGFTYIILVSLREFSTAVLLYRYGTEVAAVALFEMWEDGTYTLASAFGVIMMAILTTMLLIAQKVGAKIGIRER
jgi:iron(III) transport system permease protein